MENRTLEITHLVREVLPQKGQLKKLLWYTRDKKTCKYYLGTGNNSKTKEDMEHMVEKGYLFPLPEPVLLIEKKGLWQSFYGEIIYADLVKPNGDSDGKVLFINTEAAIPS